jgi:predicted GTPase
MAYNSFFLANSPYSKYRLDEIKSKPAVFPLDIMLVGATGAGKSTTLNALLGEEAAKVGYGSDPETEDIYEYMLNGYIRFWDTPGLGDNPEKDSEHSRKIVELFHKKGLSGEKAGKYIIDLVLVLVNASSRDIGTIYTLLNDVVYRNIDADRVLLVINQADMAMKGRHWDKTKPDETLKDFLDAQASSVQHRVEETIGKAIRKPLCYSATNEFNLYPLLDYIIDNFKWDQGKKTQVVEEAKYGWLCFKCGYFISNHSWKQLLFVPGLAPESCPACGAKGKGKFVPFRKN